MSRLTNIAATGNLGPLGGKGAGAVVKSITVNTGAASGVFTIYDGQDNTGTKLATIDATAYKQVVYVGGAWFKDGFFGVLSGGNADVTVEYE